MTDDTTVTIIRADWSADRAVLTAVRQAVFVHEQQVPPEIELDRHDPACLHVVAIAEGGQAVGTARMTPGGHIGRCAVLKEWRGRGIGSRLVRRLVDIANERGLRSVHLNSQVQAVPFYEKLGFQITGSEFYEANIAHLAMGKKTGTIVPRSEQEDYTEHTKQQKHES